MVLGSKLICIRDISWLVYGSAVLYSLPVTRVSPVLHALFWLVVEYGLQYSILVYAYKVITLYTLLKFELETLICHAKSTWCDMVMAFWKGCNNSVELTSVTSRKYKMPSTTRRRMLLFWYFMTIIIIITKWNLFIIWSCLACKHSSNISTIFTHQWVCYFKYSDKKNRTRL